MTEQFRKVDPFHISEHHYAEVFEGDQKWIEIDENHFTVPEARALRDWLTRALPEESSTGEPHGEEAKG